MSNRVTLSKTDDKGAWFSRGMERFLQEAQALAQFYDEPGVVGVRDFFEENGTAYIVMDYLDGVTMKEYVLRNGPVPPKKLFGMMEPVMAALEKIHAEGLIHRDISPDNLMLLNNGQLKLLDFGAARSVTDDKSLSVVLKPGYAPMEQYYSKGQQGPWTDVYALCATMYKCITGQTPPECLQRVYEDDLGAPSKLGIAMEPSQEAALMRGLQIRREDRIQSILELRLAMNETFIEVQHDISIHRETEKVTIYSAPVLEEEHQDETETVYSEPKKETDDITVYAATEQTVINSDDAIEQADGLEITDENHLDQVSDEDKQDDFFCENGILLAYRGKDSEVHVPDGIRRIGISAFERNCYIRNVTIPEGVFSIGRFAFTGCENLCVVRLPSTLKEIEMSAFCGCKNLTAAFFPQGLMKIGACAFAGCDALIAITIPGNIKEVPSKAFLGCKRLKRVIILDGVSAIRSAAFDKCITLEKIVIPDSVKTVEPYAFRECNNLRNTVASAYWKAAHKSDIPIRGL